MSVRYELRDRIAVVTIDRTDVRNAVDVKTAQALADAFRRFDDDEGALVAVLTGAGGYFCAGADLKVVASGEIVWGHKSIIAEMRRSVQK